jgi:Zn-dependent protease with chaperone function
MSQSIAHVVIAACVAEILVRLWRVHDPDLRVAFRALPLAFPAVVLPAFLVLAPWRRDEAFREGAALFVGSRWAALTVLGVEVSGLVFAALVGLGVALLGVDVWRILARRRPALAGIPRAPAEHTGPLVAEVAALARELAAPLPAVTVLDTPEPVLLVSGLRRPALVISRGVLERLDARERRAALAHELAHLARRDGLAGWALLACRVVLAFNPAAQVVARGVARELECRADALAVRAGGDRDALGAALARLAGGHGGVPAATSAYGRWRRLADEILRRGRLAAVARRRQRLQRASGETGRELEALRLAGAGVGLVLLLFFVV